ncbi:MFS transporter [Streptomyces xanthochromogenes]|uniref:MFS transporter n=1 Tax=Streptomyces TaxID=1883 RepID=UPI00136A17D6|nr:MFS transporter [Streptomyces sp. SID1034]MYV92428.1 MFS transporter [Streptomyces sp. SID1034]
MKRYAQVLAVPGVGRTVALGWLVKLPMIATPVVLALQVSVGLGLGLGSAGLVTGAWMIGAMVGSPFLGRAMDRHGLRRVLLLSAAAQGVFWGVAALLPQPALAVGALASGLLLVPGSTVVRLVVSASVPAQHRQTGFALDSVTSQLSYLLGPGIAAVVATQLSPALATRLLGCVLVLATTALALYVPMPPAEEDAKTTAAPSAAGGRTLGLLPVLACTFAAGTVSSGFEISLLGVLRSEGEVAWIGLLIAACGAYAVAGGFLFGMLSFPVPPWAPVLLLGLATGPLAFVSDWRILLVAVLPAAMLSAASFAATATEVGRVSDERTRGRTMGLYGSALAGGNALGAPLAGLGSGWTGQPSAGFLIIGAAAAATALAGRLLRPRPAASPTAAHTAEVPSHAAQEG